jgi:methylenetetrahydrofolate dehydrogenase (NADP+)/methenyltetrahydrofolate cyclohydrolase
MTAQIIDGKAISAEVKDSLEPRIAALKEKGIRPRLEVVLVGEDPASMTYVRMKEKACIKLGIESDTHRLPDTTTQETLLKMVKDFNADPKVHGILVQLPLPAQVDELVILEAIEPSKDVDGFAPVSLGRLLAGKDGFAPATPSGIVELLIRSGNPPDGKRVVIVGRSNIVGKPLAALLMQKREGANATVTVCHSRTPDIGEHTRNADILVAAIGRPNFITADMVGEGVVVIDVGINRVDDPSAKRGYRLVGDVHFEEVAKKAGAITPVPGGVGPMTIAMLMSNTVTAAEKSLGQ